jgi:prepilin-type N-terminal cleavage/methylation domain-containing protein
VRQKGFTLVEAMVGLAIFAVVSLVMVSTFLVGYKTISNEARVIAADTAVSEASLTLVRDLNSANAPLLPGTIPSGAITLTYGSPPVPVAYSIDASHNLIRTVNGTDQVAARGVTSVTITVAGCYATVTIQPSAAGAAAATLNVSNRPGGCF